MTAKANCRKRHARVLPSKRTYADGQTFVCRLDGVRVPMIQIIVEAQTNRQ
jgi:hypothetical protein